jgi:lipid-binding SYLF domain-containing protein
VEGGSIGFQLGGEATDLILLVMNEKGADSILNSKVKLGADVSIAAGPKGRDAEAATDAYMGAEILSYSRSRGLFAGVSLAGSSLRPDNEANERVYGRKITAKDIVLGHKVAIPQTGRHLVSVLQKHALRHESKQASTR